MLNKIISNMNLRKKIFLIIFTFVVPFILIVSIALTIFGFKIYDYINDDMYKSKNSLVNAFENLKKQTATYGSMISKNYPIQRGVYFNDTGNILKYIQPVFKEMQVDFITFHDLDNNIIAQADQPDKFNILDSNKTVLSAQQGISSSTIEYLHGDVILKNTSPIYHLSMPDLIVGSVSIGYKLSKSLIEKLHNLVGVDILFSLDYKIFASTFKDKQFRQNCIYNQNKSLKINNTEYDVSYIPISTLNNKNFGVYVAVDNSILKDTLFWIIMTAAILFLFTIVIALMISMKIGYNITDSISTILKSTREIANQNYDVNIKLNTNDEFKELADTFNMIVANINMSFSEVKKQNNKIKDLQDYLSNIIESMPSMLISLDEEEKVTQWNSAAVKITGVKSFDAIGHKFSDVFSFLDDDNKYADFFNQVRMTNQTLEIRREKLKNIPDKYFNLKIYPIITNGATGIVIIIEDISRVEKREAQLRQAQKMETVGTLAGGLAHDFNNVLAGIIGTLSIMKFSLNNNKKIDDQKLMDYLNTMENSGNRAADMVKQLLTLSRKHEISFAPVDLNSTIKYVYKICQNSFDKSIELSPEYVQTRAMVSADPTQIGQVLLNLCVNSAHAMTIMRKEDEHKGGKLTISLDKIFADHFFCSTHPEAKELDYWILSTKDNGIGMDSKILSKIFDPFFTTKEKDKGTGLGLAMVYNIIKLHNGFIDVYSESGLGSTFNIYLPVLHDEQIESEQAAETICRGEGLILVVDDEMVIRNITKSILIECGYKVILAKNGKEGIELYKKHYHEIKAVLLDMVMPILSGEEAFREFQKINSDVKVLLASGFRKDERVQALLDLGIIDFLQKPYTLEKLSKAIHETIVS